MPVFSERTKSNADSILAISARIRQDEEGSLKSWSDESLNSQQHEASNRRRPGGEPDKLSLVSRFRRLNDLHDHSTRMSMIIDENIEKSKDFIENFDNMELHLATEASKRVSSPDEGGEISEIGSELTLKPSGFLIPSTATIHESSQEREEKPKVDMAANELITKKSSLQKSKKRDSQLSKPSKSILSPKGTAGSSQNAKVVGESSGMSKPTINSARKSKTAARSNTVSFIEKNKNDVRRASSQNAANRFATTAKMNDIPTVVMKPEFIKNKSK